MFNKAFDVGTIDHSAHDCEEIKLAFNRLVEKSHSILIRNRADSQWWNG
jgi:hypothetical protein